MRLRNLVEEKFSDPTPCYGHCQEQSTVKFLSGDGNLLACFACPTGYVSRIAQYGEELNLDSFKKFLYDLLGEQKVKDEDIRVATRYSWDLGVGTGDEKVIRTAYWTQNYRRTKSDDPNRSAVFLCSNCNSLFIQPLTSKNTLCENCR